MFARLNGPEGSEPLQLFHPDDLAADGGPGMKIPEWSP